MGNLRESKQAACPGRQLGTGERADDKELSSYGDEEGGGAGGGLMEGGVALAFTEGG